MQVKSNQQTATGNKRDINVDLKPDKENNIEGQEKPSMYHWPLHVCNAKPLHESFYVLSYACSRGNDTFPTMIRESKCKRLKCCLRKGIGKNLICFIGPKCA